MAFRGKRVLLSPDLVPATLLEMLHDALKANGAEVCLFSNPSYNSKSDFHVLPSGDSKMLTELRSKGCNVIGTECILRCIKERRPLPTAGYTCCMGLDGMRIMSIGFDSSEKTRIQRMITNMCGTPVTKSSMDVDVILAKNVLTEEYKWATFTLRRPILKVDWLYHCHQDHKRVPYEQFQLPMFTGVVLSTTGISSDDQHKMSEIVKEHGGVWSGDLTDKCTHLIAKSTESEKYKFATAQGVRIICVNEMWFWDSVSEKAFLDERSFPVNMEPSKSSASWPLPPVPATGYDDDVSLPPVCEPELDVDTEIARLEPKSCCCQEMYLSGCRVHFVGFQPDEMRKLVHLVLDGGGTRYKEFNDSVTHVIVGEPTEREVKEIKEYAMSGLIYIVLPSWLEECRRQRREVVVSAKFVVPQSRMALQSSLLSQGRSKSVSVNGKKSGDQREHQRLERRGHSVPKQFANRKGSFVSSQDRAASKADELKKPLTTLRMSQREQALPNSDHQTPTPGSMHLRGSNSQLRSLSSSPGVWESRKGLLSSFSLTEETTAHLARGQGREDANLSAILRNPERENGNLAPSSAATQSMQPSFQGKKSNLFQGCTFAFSKSFDPPKRPEVVDWIIGGGGIFLEKDLDEDVRFMIYPHGRHSEAQSNSHVTIVTPQWILCCLQEGSLLDVQGHIIFQPLQCEAPLPGFETFKFAFSQFSERELVPLRNLCFILGSRHMMTRMSRKETHLLCKVADGEKYKLAMIWATETVTVDWLYACVAENCVVSTENYRPRKVTVADMDIGRGQSSVGQTSSTAISSKHFESSSAEKDSIQMQSELQSTQLDGIKDTGFRRSSTLGAKSRTPARRIQTRAVAKFPVASQMTSGGLDPWDELAASWESRDGQGLAATQQLKKAQSGSQDHQPNDIHDQVQDDQVDDRREYLDDGAEEIRPRANEVDEENEETEGDKEETDVASAIEGLLAQTKKVEDESAFEQLDVDINRLSPDSIKLNRLSNADLLGHNNRKRVKMLSSRPTDSSLEPTATASGESMEKFEESQMGSQVVAYDEDNSEKDRIMERVRTRSMSFRSTSGSGLTTSSIQYNRLMKAADANK